MPRRKDDVELLKTVIGHITSTRKLLPPEYGLIDNYLEQAFFAAKGKLGQLLVNVELENK